MSLNNFSDKEKQVIRECLQAVMHGPFFPEWEFSTLFGFERKELGRLLNQTNELDDKNEFVSPAINNVLVNLIGYPHGVVADWSKWISVPQTEVEIIYNKWRSAA